MYRGYLWFLCVINLLLIHFSFTNGQLGATTRVIWQPVGLDTLSGSMATCYHHASTIYNLDFRIGITCGQVSMFCYARSYSCDGYFICLYVLIG